MKYTTLPGTDIKISKLCLGTMTWGQQNTESEGHEQMNHAVDNGINFFDTAELYSVPARPETQGTTEKIIGTWFKKTGNRDKIILATKISGPMAFAAHIRDNLGFSKEAIHDAVNKSLKRLQTDYIDLYQLHWPDRSTNFFGQRGYKHNTEEKWKDNFKEILEVFHGLVKEGKIRHLGVSNETPWGTMRFLEESQKHHLPRIRSIQNPYSLLNRTFETGLAEVSIRENVGLLAYSPLAFGVLSGKYLFGKPENARITLFPNYSRYSNPQAVEATKKYYNLAKENGFSSVQMALAFVTQQPFVAANIIGATSVKQLKENIESIHLELDEMLLYEINKIHDAIPSPAP